jgi:hypothetical protein
MRPEAVAKRAGLLRAVIVFAGGALAGAMLTMPGVAAAAKYQRLSGFECYDQDFSCVRLASSAKTYTCGSARNTVCPVEDGDSFNKQLVTSVVVRAELGTGVSPLTAALCATSNTVAGGACGFMEQLVNTSSGIKTITLSTTAELSVWKDTAKANHFPYVIVGIPTGTVRLRGIQVNYA